jgi:molecular chaperone GrpE
MNLDDVLQSLDPIEFEASADEGGDEITTVSNALRRMIVLGNKVGKSEFRTGQAAGLISSRLDQLEEQFGQQLRDREQDLKEARRQVGELDEANERFVVGLIQIADLVDSALRAAEVEADAETKEDLDRLGREIRKVLKRLGLEALAAEDEPQNPEFHEVVSEADATDARRGTIIEIIRQGYRYAGQVYRIAKVVVAK